MSVKGAASRGHSLIVWLAVGIVICLHVSVWLAALELLGRLRLSQRVVVIHGVWLNYLGIKELLALFNSWGTHDWFSTCFLLALKGLLRDKRWWVILRAHFFHLGPPQTRVQLLARIDESLLSLRSVLFVNHFEMLNLFSKALDLVHLAMGSRRTQHRSVWISRYFRLH